MRFTGTLSDWNDDRGFGFIAPAGGGAKVFVHASAFPRDGTRPVEDEPVSYEPGRRADGRPQAVRVVRRALGPGPGRSRAETRRSPRARARWRSAVVVALLIAAVAWGYGRFVRTRDGASPAIGRSDEARRATAGGTIEAPPPARGATYRCDGRTHCPQMTSCAEATWFLKNCPGIEMDGNRDGVPCERQWCRP